MCFFVSLDCNGIPCFLKLEAIVSQEFLSFMLFGGRGSMR